MTYLCNNCLLIAVGQPFNFKPSCYLSKFMKFSAKSNCCTVHQGRIIQNFILTIKLFISINLTDCENIYIHLSLISEIFIYRSCRQEMVPLYTSRFLPSGASIYLDPVTVTVEGTFYVTGKRGDCIPQITPTGFHTRKHRRAQQAIWDVPNPQQNANLRKVMSRQVIWIKYYFHAFVEDMQC